MEKMVCIKRLNVVGGKSSNLTIGKTYTVSILPSKTGLVENNPRVMVWKDDINSEYIYPLHAFVSLEQWRELKLKELGI